MSRHSELAAEWDDEFGDHEECPVCGTNCRDHFLGDTLTPAQKAASEMLEALKRIDAWHSGGVNRRDLEMVHALIAKAEGSK